MHHLAITAVATALFVGAGAGALTGVNAPPAEPKSDVANPMIEGQAMLPSESIFDGASRSPEHAVFTSAVKASGSEALLSGQGPLTVFAPTDAAYAALGRDAEHLPMSPSRRAALARSVDYLIVPGRLDSQVLLRLINQNEGRAILKTVEGGTLVAQMNGPTNITLMDEKGHIADVSIYDIYQSNGVMHVVDKVLLPDERRLSASR